MTEPEEWRTVPGFPRYQASNLGRIRNGRGKIIGRGSNRKGYMVVTLVGDDTIWRTSVHRVVARAFHGPAPKDQHARHLDGQKRHNVPSNIAYGTAAENNEDRRRHGTTARGERINTAKLTPEQASEIYDLFDPKAGLTFSAIARRFDVNITTVRDILRRANWTHVNAHKPDKTTDLLPNGKLTITEIQAIRADPRGPTPVGRDFGIHPGTVWAIRNPRPGAYSAAQGGES